MCPNKPLIKKQFDFLNFFRRKILEKMDMFY